MSNPKVFFVSHPDDSTYPLDYEQVVPAAKQYGVALEVNNNTVRSARKKNWRENIMTYLDLCMRYRTSIVVDSDAHDPSTVGRFMEAEALLDGFGFDEDLIVNTSEEEFRSFIGFAK
jgi:putative hydrolase